MLMPRKVTCYIVDGTQVVPKKMVWEGTSLVSNDKDRLRFLVRSKPRNMTKSAFGGLVSKSRNVFFASTRSATTYDPDDFNGVTLDDPAQESIATSDTIDGYDADKNPIFRKYRITPEHIYEVSENSDLKGLNLALRPSWPILFMAMGAGAGAFVLLFVIIRTFGPQVGINL